MSGWEEGKGWMDALVPLRADLLAGDYRSLYLGWLGWIECVDPEESGDLLEPPVPPGLQKLTKPLEKLAEFLYIDNSLLAVAARNSAAGGTTGFSSEELAAWIAAQPDERKHAWLLNLVEEKEPAPRFEILREFRKAWTAARPKGKASQGTRRTVRQLLADRDVYQEERDRRVTREKAQARTAHLESLIGREEDLWADIEKVLASRKRGEYERAVRLIQDLSELAERKGQKETFLARLAALRARHKGKSGFLHWLNQVGL